MLGLIDEVLKQFYHGLGFNIVAIGPDKVPVDANGNRLTGPILYEHKPLEQYVLDSENWGLRHSTDPRCANIIFLDWDKGTILNDLKKFMLTYRKKGEQDSYHGVIKVTDADGTWCKDFVKQYGIDGLEMFAGNKNFVMFGTYKIKDSDQTAKWHWIDDIRKTRKIIEVTKADLGKIFSKKTTKSTSGIVPKGQGLRHEALLVEGIKSVKKLTKSDEDVNIDSVCRSLLQTQTIEGMNEYAKGGSKHSELIQIAAWCIENAESEKQEFGFEYIKMKGFNFAHDLSDKSDEFNCYHWTGSAWNELTGHFLLSELQKISIKDFKPTKDMAKSIQAKLSADIDTLQVDPKSDEEKLNASRRIYTTTGQYFDLATGKIESVDPNTMFSRTAQVKIEVADEESQRFWDLLNSRFSERDSKILFDHLSSGFIHNRDLGAKPSTLTVQGLPDTFKSLLIEILKAILSDDVVSEQSMSGLIKNERWAKYLLRDNLWNLQEETEPERIQSAKIVKEVVTAMDGKAEKKGKGEVYVSRFPRWLITCNIVQPIPIDDDNDSIIKRSQFIQMQQCDDGIDWREELMKPEELKKIARMLLNRASEIYTKTKPINMQELEERKSVYRYLVEGDFAEYVQNNYITQGVGPDVGTRFQYILSHYNETQKNTMSNSVLTLKFEELGYEKKIRHWVFKTNEKNVYCEDDPNTDEAKTQQSLIMGLKPKMLTKSATASGLKY